MIEHQKLNQQVKEGLRPLCLRCQSETEYLGTKQFHEGTVLELRIGGVRSLFFDTYVCSTCGKMEFFAEGIGDVARGETPSENG